VKHTIKDEIRNSLIPLSIKPKLIFNEVSQEMRFICLEYDAIKSQIIRNINKQLPPDVSKFNEVPNEWKYYKIIRNANFMIFNNPYYLLILILRKIIHEK